MRVLFIVAYFDGEEKQIIICVKNRFYSYSTFFLQKTGKKAPAFKRGDELPHP